MKPYPLVGLNHLTVPVATITLHCSIYGPTIIRQKAGTGYGSKPNHWAIAARENGGANVQVVSRHWGSGLHYEVGRGLRAWPRTHISMILNLSSNPGRTGRVGLCSVRLDAGVQLRLRIFSQIRPLNIGSIPYPNRG